MKQLELKSLGKWSDLKSDPPEPGYMLVILSEKMAIHQDAPFAGVIIPGKNPHKVKTTYGTGEIYIPHTKEGDYFWIYLPPYPEYGEKKEESRIITLS